MKYAWIEKPMAQYRGWGHSNARGWTERIGSETSRYRGWTGRGKSCLEAPQGPGVSGRAA